MIPSLTECKDTNEGKNVFNPAQISCGVQARLHRGCQQRQTLRTLTVLELQQLRLHDKTSNGTILFWLLPGNGRRGPLRESARRRATRCLHDSDDVRAKIRKHVELQRAASATRSRARRQYRSPFALFPEREKKMCTHPKEDPAR